MRRQGIGFSPEIETLSNGNTPLLDPSRQGIGFSPEIETLKGIVGDFLAWAVARGLASRLRLKLELGMG